MSNYQEVIDLAKVLTGNENLYSLQPFIKITGDTTLGLVLERIVYWSDRSANKELRRLKIFYKSAEEWEDEIGLSYAQVTLIRKKLEKMGFIQTSKHKVGGAPTVHYYANMIAIKEAVTLYCQDKNSEYANHNNVEIQEVSNSESSKLQIQQSSNSYNNSSNSITPNGVGKRSKKPVKESSRNGPRWQLMDEFCEYSGIPLPENRTDKDFWFARISAIYEISKRDADVGKRLIRASIDKLRRDGMTVYDPGSLVKTARVLMAELSLHAGKNVLSIS